MSGQESWHFSWWKFMQTWDHFIHC